MKPYCAALGLSLLLGAAIPAQGFAADQDKPFSKMNSQRMTYEVYAGGIDAVTADFNVTYDGKGRYNMFLSAATQGFLGSLVPWQGSFETKGWRLSDGRETPELHKSVAQWRDEVEVKEYKYTKDGRFDQYVVNEDGEDKSPEKPDDKLTQGTTDALTATLMVMKKVAETGECAGSSEVFDGKRRFNLVFKAGAEEYLEPTEYNVYKGPALRCEVEVKPVAGLWHEKPRGWMSIQEQGRELGSLPQIWLARIDRNGPAVPVKLRIKTDYGTLFAHLIDYKQVADSGAGEQTTKQAGLEKEREEKPGQEVASASSH